MRKIILLAVLSLIVQNVFSQQQDSITHYDLNEVIVTTTRMNTRLKNLPQKVEIIDSKTLQSLPFNNLADILKTSTNIDIIQYPGLSSNIGMRGFSPSAHSRSYTLMLLDGKPMGTSNISCVDKDIVERVEIIKGPYSILYGSDAMGGVINIITKKVSAYNSGSASVSAGSNGHIKINGNVNGALNSNSGFQFGFTHNEQRMDYRIGKSNLLKLSGKEKMLLDEASFGDVMKNSKWQYNQINGRYNLKLNSKWESDFQAIYFNANDIEIPGNYWGSYGQSKKNINRLNFYGTLSRVSSKNQFYFSPYYTTEVNENYTDNSDTGFVSFESKIREYGFKMHNVYKLGNLDLFAGADLDVYDYASERFKGKATPTNPYSPNHNNIKAALLTQLNYSGNGFDINAGLRYSYIIYNIEKNDSLNGTGGKEFYNALNPSLGLQYTFPFQLRLHSSYGTGFSVPDAFKVAGFYSVSEYFAQWDYWWVKNYQGNPELKPESSANIDFGLSYSHPDKLVFFDITYFQNWHNDKIVEHYLDSLEHDGEVLYKVTSYKNANNSLMQGIELVASGNLGSLFNNRFKLEVYGNFTYMLNNTVDENLISSTGNDSIVTRDLLYARKSNINFGIGFDNFNGFSTRIHARYTGRRLERDNFSKLRPGITSDDYYNIGGYTSDDKILQHPDFLIIDYSIAYTLNKKRFMITISNLFDENYTEKDGYNMSGRVISASFNYVF